MTELLEACPICAQIKDGKCSDVGREDGLGVLNMDDHKVVVLLRHSGVPTTNEVEKACVLLVALTGSIFMKDLSIPGHWSISSVKGVWSASKSVARSGDIK